VLYVAFAFAPGQGSEPGVGWNWAIETARDEEVCVITHAYFRSAVEEFLEARPVARLSVEFYSPFWSRLFSGDRVVLSRLYYVAWQIGLRWAAKRLLKGRTFRYVHALTWGTFRFPCLLTNLNCPFVIGPVGGAERAPSRLFKGLPFRERAIDLLRDLTMNLSRLDPLVRYSLANASVVLFKTNETKEFLRGIVRGHSHVTPEIGARAVLGTNDREVPRPKLQLLFAGRLLGWKGIHIVLEVARQLLLNGKSFELCIAGDGNLRSYAENLISKSEMGGSVTLIGKITREALYARYASSDIFLFPSLHDSSGNVVLEALSVGLPVVCLDLGGPKYFVDDNCGAVVSTDGRDVQEIAADIARILEDIDELTLRRWRVGALAMASKNSWHLQVARARAIVEAHL
jgi:glycosyltransferase involved in cell wall biosynthesis